MSTGTGNQAAEPEELRQFGAGGRDPGREGQSRGRAGRGRAAAPSHGGAGLGLRCRFRTTPHSRAAAVESPGRRGQRFKGQ